MICNNSLTNVVTHACVRTFIHDNVYKLNSCMNISKYKQLHIQSMFQITLKHGNHARSYKI